MEVSISMYNKKTGDLCIKNNNSKYEIIINQETKELKASEIIKLLDYSEDKSYLLEELTEDQKNNKYFLSIQKILLEILEKVNNKE